MTLKTFRVSLHFNRHGMPFIGTTCMYVCTHVTCVRLLNLCCDFRLLGTTWARSGIPGWFGPEPYGSQLWVLCSDFSCPLPFAVFPIFIFLHLSSQRWLEGIKRNTERTPSNLFLGLFYAPPCSHIFRPTDFHQGQLCEKGECPGSGPVREKQWWCPATTGVMHVCKKRNVLF